MENLLNMPQPKAHYAMTGFNIIPTQLETPVEFTLYGKYSAKVVSADGINISGEKTFGVKYGPNLQFYTTLTEKELTEQFQIRD